jgi:PelA/Pel-15E family pectate lyase
MLTNGHRNALQTARCLAITIFMALGIGLSAGHAASPIDDLLQQPNDWFASESGHEVLQNVIVWQSQHGDWPKNVNTTGPLKVKPGKRIVGTFDNGATTGELRLLARAFLVTAIEDYRDAFLRGFDHIIRAQYPNGGWPQFFPLSTKYHRHITFNDNTMIRLLEFLRDVSTKDDFQFVDPDRRASAVEALKRGVDCIIRCQVLVDGKPTVWCAQHDAETLAPTGARSYELPSLSGSESAGILVFLMSIETPSQEIIRAVKGGVDWFDNSKIEGQTYRRSKELPALTPAPDAKPLWSRFYEVESNRPIFSDRDGVVKYDLSEIGSERRSGYAWYGNWGNKVLDTYARWPQRSAD